MSNPNKQHNKIMNERFKMPWLWCLTDEEVFDLWSSYDQLHKKIRVIEQRTGMYFTDEEVHIGYWFRAQQLLKESEKRDDLRGNALMPPTTND